MVVGDQVLITRLFAAPRELVYRAWTEKDHLVNWYAPHGCTIEIVTMDVRVGGAIHTCIRNPGYDDCWVAGEFTEVVAPSKLAYRLHFSDKEGNFVEPADAGPGRDPEWPRETTIAITFEEENGQTRLTLRQDVAAAAAQRTGALPSWHQMLDRLELELENTK